MSTYIIGDVHGCCDTLIKLLDCINFKSSDILWFTGDLINKGPKSLNVLNFIKALGNRAVCVIGNHEISLLMFYYGINTKKKSSMLNPILESKECVNLIEWIRNWPLIHIENKFVMVHAGILPCWSIEQAYNEALNVQTIIRSKEVVNFLKYRNKYKNKDFYWQESLKGFKRAATALNAFTYMRFCTSPSRMHFEFYKNPKESPNELMPWYLRNKQKTVDYKIFFGHWSTLGLRVIENNVSLDSGCVWGNFLSAYRIEDGSVFTEKSIEINKRNIFT